MVAGAGRGAARAAARAGRGATATGAGAPSPGDVARDVDRPAADAGAGGLASRGRAAGAALPRPAVVSRPPRPAAPPVEVLYRRAHELHFHGGDPAAALAAWDAYLAAEPRGQFSVEARYNRALLLVRLGRHAEARAALLPFARGGVVPEGYRQPEAEQLVERLARDE